MDKGLVLLTLLGCYFAFVVVYFYDFMVFIRRSTPFALSNTVDVDTTTISYNDQDNQTDKDRESQTDKDRGSQTRNPTYLPNEVFLQTVDFRRDFMYSDTQQVEEEDPTITCLPKLFGYSEAEGNRVFPEYIYPDCKEVTQGPFPELYLDYENNQFSMKCPEGKPFYLKDPDVNRRRLYQKYELESEYEFKEYKGPVDMEKGEEFVYAGCNSDESLNNAIYIPRKNSTAYETAKQKIKQHQKRTGITKKPQILFILTIDSFSRPHFFRKLPNTVKYLNNLNKNPDFSIFDMKLHNILGATSVDNTIPIFASKLYYRYFNA